MIIVTSKPDHSGACTGTDVRSRHPMRSPCCAWNIARLSRHGQRVGAERWGCGRLARQTGSSMTVWTLFCDANCASSAVHQQAGAGLVIRVHIKPWKGRRGDFHPDTGDPFKPVGFRVKMKGFSRAHHLAKCSAHRQRRAASAWAGVALLSVPEPDHAEASRTNIAEPLGRLRKNTTQPSAAMPLRAEGAVHSFTAPAVRAARM